MEKLLEKHNWIAGDDLTIADFSFISMMPTFKVSQ